jgi:hypothetical protein
VLLLVSLTGERATYNIWLLSWTEMTCSLRYPIDLCKNLDRNHPVFAFLAASRFAARIVSLPLCQFCRDTDSRRYDHI